MLNLPFWRTSMNKKPISTQAQKPDVKKNLAEVKVGTTVKVKGFGLISMIQKQHLQAYGLLPGRTVQVLAQRPVTIILIEQTELAFENQIADQIWIE